MNREAFGAAMGFIMMCLLAVVAMLSWDLGQRSIIKSCEKVSFFYLDNKTFECMAVHKELGK